MAKRWSEVRGGRFLLLPLPLLLLLSLLAPSAALTFRLPLAEEKWSAGILELIGLLARRPEALRFWRSEMGSALFGHVFRLFAAVSILFALAALLSLAVIVCTALSLRKQRFCAVAAILSFAGAALMLGAFVSAILLSFAARGSEFVTASMGLAAPCAMSVFLCLGLINTLRRKDAQEAKAGPAIPKKWLLRAGIAALALALAGGAIWGVTRLPDRDPPAPGPTPEEQAILEERSAILQANAPATAVEMAQYIDGALQYAQEVNPALRLNRAYSLTAAHLDELRFDIPGTLDPLDEGMAGRLRAAMALMAPALAEQLNSGLAEQATEAGEDVAALLWGMDLRGEDIEEPVCDWTAYGDSEAWLGEYAITFPFKDGAPNMRAMFRPPASTEVYGLVAETLAPWADIADITPQAVRNASIVTVVRAAADKESPNQLVSQRFRCDFELRITCKPKGELEPLGGFTVILAVGSEAAFAFDWAEE